MLAITGEEMGLAEAMKRGIIVFDGSESTATAGRLTITSFVIESKDRYKEISAEINTAPTLK